jgi:hypothetical protein
MNIAAELTSTFSFTPGFSQVDWSLLGMGKPFKRFPMKN